MLNCKNSSTTDDLTDVYIEIGSTSSFYGYPSNFLRHTTEFLIMMGVHIIPMKLIWFIKGSEMN